MNYFRGEGIQESVSKTNSKKWKKRERSGLQEKCQGLPRENAEDGKLPLYIHHDKDWIRQELWMKGKPKRKFWKFWFYEKQNQKGNFDEKQDIFLGLPTNCLLVTKEEGEEKRELQWRNQTSWLEIKN